MIDINFLRAQPEKVRDLLKIKNYDLKIDLFRDIDSERKTLQVLVEDLKISQTNLRCTHNFCTSTHRETAYK